MKNWFIGTSVVLVLAAAGCATSAERHPWERDPVFLAKDAISITDAIPPVPARHSKVDDADFAELFKRQAGRTAAECARAESEVKVSLDTFYGPKYGPLTEAEVARWTPFFERVRIDTDFFVQSVKRQWKRPRPYQSDDKLSPCIKRELTPAYPSGHAAIAKIFADVLRRIDPKRARAFDDRALQLARDRVLGGVHHPSDVEMGAKLGDEVFEALSKNAQFNQELAQAKAAP